MSESAAGRVALVSGSAQGIGFGIVRALARAGFRAAVTDHRLDAAIESAASLRSEGLTAEGFPLDVRIASDWETAVRSVLDRWGRIDVLVNSAGISPRGTALTTDEELWQRTLDINLKGPWLGIRACLPALIETRGVIVNIGSTRATRPMPGLFSYITSKAGLLGLTQQVAVEYLDKGVTCNMVAPGWVDTPGERIIQAEQGRPDFPKGVENLITSDEIGDAVVHFTTPAGRRSTGTIFYVDAGLHIADDAGMVYFPRASHPRYHVTE